ncbi:MDM1 protein, partial [Eudromia elegans]|nr:MDM1 protein [Eudromia elegans]
LGISREPKFISKRRVPYRHPQISKSFEWTADGDLNDPLEAEALQAAELQGDYNNDEMNQEKMETPEGPRRPAKVHSHSADSGAETALALPEDSMKRSLSAAPPNQDDAFVSPKKELEKVENGLHRVLQRKAGMNISRLNTFPRNSEYQSQFVWKSPHEKSPILAAEQVIHNASKSLPPFKSAITTETECEGNVEDSPVKSPQLRCDPEEKEFLVCEQSKRKEPFQRPTEDASKQGKKSEQKHPKQKNKQHISQKPLSLHTSRGKLNTEYRSKFLSPAQYLYKDGAWSRIRNNVHNQASQNTLNSMWYMEVKELRARAKAYRQRLEGTHFSRHHLNQILSDNNSLWDVSSSSSSEEGISSNIRALDLAGVSEKETSPSPKVLQQPGAGEELHQDSPEKKDLSNASTVPVKRRLVWGEEEGTGEGDNQPSTEEEEKENEPVASMAQELGDKDGIEDEKNEGEKALELHSCPSDSSVSSGTGGRLPTPKLRALGGPQRTHHDLTTPVVGGAVLVSPPKLKLSSPQWRTRDLGTNRSPAKQGAREASKRRTCRPAAEVDAVSLLTSPPAGLGTVDPLPLRQDQWPDNGTSAERVPLASQHAERPSAPAVLRAAQVCSAPSWSPSRRIQGTLKDPEFQHNGNVVSPRMRSFQLPLQERNGNDE